MPTCHASQDLSQSHCPAGLSVVGRQFQSEVSLHPATQASLKTSPTSPTACLTHLTIVTSNHHRRTGQFLLLGGAEPSLPQKYFDSNWKCKWLGYVLRHDVLLKDTLEVRMLGKHTRGRKRLELEQHMPWGNFLRVSKEASWRQMSVKGFRDGSQWADIYSSTSVCYVSNINVRRKITSTHLQERCKEKYKVKNHTAASE